VSDAFFADSSRLTHAGARAMVAAALAEAVKAGVAVTCAVCDGGGHIIAIERMDNGRFHTVHSATTKAVCAASNKRPTTMKGAAGQVLDATRAIGLSLAAGADRWTAMEGGYPILLDGECIGGVGVSGADWETDARLARAAVAAIGARWE